MKYIDRNINKIVNVFSSSFVLGSIGNTIISNTYVLFMSSSKGFTDVQISIILGVLPLISVFTYFLWGIVIDRYKKLLLIGKIVNILNLITLFSLILIDDFTTFFIINLIRNIMMQPGNVVNDEYLLNLSNKHGVRFGKIRVFSTIGYGIAGVICTILLNFISPEKTVLVASVFIILNLIAICLLPEITSTTNTDNIKVNPLTNLLNVLQNREFRGFILTYSLITAVIGSAVGYGIPILLIKLKAPNSYIGILPILMIVFEVILLPIIEKFKFYRNINLVLKISIAILLFRWLVIGITDLYIVIVSITLIHGVINGLLLPLQNRVIWNIVPKEHHSTAIVIANLAGYNIFPAIINLITGSISGIVGFKSYGIVYFIITLIALIILIKNNYRFEPKLQEC